jgi:hypothetical protein
MKCPGCQHDNRVRAKFCEECGRPLSRLALPRGTLRAHTGRPHRNRRPIWVRDVVATLIVVLGGAAIIAGIIAGNPRWHIIIASWRDGPAENPSVASIGLTRVQSQPAGSDAPVSGVAAVAVPRGPTHVSGPHRAQSGGIRSDSVQSYDPTRLVPELPSGSQPDLQIMVNLLVAELGPGSAWRTALTNADAHDPDSPEFNYWHRVAAAIRAVGSRRR